MTKTYKMKIAYDGTQYGGWQIQKNALSIQTVIQNALATLLRRQTPVVASGRIDAGVHALGQIAHFRCPQELQIQKILLSLNALLPVDIRILSLELVEPAFHARFSALSKIYNYYLCLDNVSDPFQRLYMHRPPHRVDVELLKSACHYFIGTHDFTSFANTRSCTHSNPKQGNIRTIQNIALLEKRPFTTLSQKTSGRVICLSFEGNGFLYKMVRNIVGTLLDVCAGRLCLNAIPHIFAARDRRSAGIAAPAQGLFLAEVKYSP